MCFRMATFQVDDNISRFPHINNLDSAWTKSEICETVVYKEASNESGDLATAFNARSTGNKKLYCNLPVGLNECIVPKTIEFLYGLTMQVDGTLDWAMAKSDGTRPAGVPAAFKLVRPLDTETVNYCTYAGIRPTMYAATAQLNKLQVQMIDSGSIVDSVFDSNAKSTTSLAQNVILDAYCNQPGVNVDGDPLLVNDMRLFMPDRNGNLCVKYSDAFTTSNTLLDARRVARGDKPVQLTERVWNRILNTEQQSLFVQLKSKLASAFFLPPGFGFKLVLEVLDGSDRLDTEMKVQVNRAPDGQAAEWQTVVAKIQFDSLKIRFQALQLPDYLLREYNSGKVLGSQFDIDSVDHDGMTQNVPAMRVTCTDIVQQYNSCATGSAGTQLVLNSGDKQPLPQFVVAYVTKPNNAAFTTAGLSTSNWNCLSWAEPIMKTFRATCSEGAADRPPFLNIYPNNDVSLPDIGELNIMAQNTSGQQFWNQTGPRFQTLLAQHLLSGVATYMVAGGYPAASLPARNIMSWYTDPSTPIVFDASKGVDQSQLTIYTDFTKTTTEPLNWVAAQFSRSEVVFNIEPRKYDTYDDIKPVYSLNKYYSGLAFRDQRINTSCKNNTFIIFFVYRCLLVQLIGVSLSGLAGCPHLRFLQLYGSMCQMQLSLFHQEICGTKEIIHLSYCFGDNISLLK